MEPLITFVYRKGLPSMFSIEKLFDTLYDHLEASGVALCRLELPHVSTGISSVLHNLWFVARRRRSSVLHITGDVHYAALLRPFAHTVITVHDCVVLQRGTGFKRFAMRALWFGLPMRLASVVVVISEQTKRELLSTVRIAERKIKVIPNFVDPAFEFSEKPFPDQAPRVLHVGTTANKNLPRVIAALRGLSCTLVIVGELQPAIRQKLLVSEIRYENFVSVDHTTMRRLYRDADLVSFPSTYEGFGMPVIEAQAVGRPVLTSDREPMRSVAGPSGALFVDPECVTSMRDGFVNLLRDAALRARLVAAGRNNCRRFTLDAVAAQYRDVYRSFGEPVPSYRASRVSR